MILENKTIIVTGGSDGIGLEISKKIVKNGGNVIICSRNQTKITNAINLIYELYHKQQLHYKLDVIDKYSIHNFFNWLYTENIKVDGLVNCAGIYGPIGKSTNIGSDDIIKTLNVNLIGSINMTQFFINNNEINPNLRKIVNIAGGGAAGPFPNYNAYSMSKIALVRFTENLALELQNDNIEVNCIAPGFVNTKIHDSTLIAGPDIAGQDFFNKTKILLDDNLNIGTEAADLTSFLLSDESNGINGKFISAVWDDWSNSDFQELLKSDKDFATLRRIDNKNYFKK